MNNVQYATIMLASDEELVTKKKDTGKKRPNFYMIGNGTTNKEGTMAINLIHEFLSMTKAEMTVINWVMDYITWDNRTGEVIVHMANLTSAQKQQFKRGFKELSEKDLIRRTKRSHYMLNPNAVIPLDYDLALELWDSVEPKKK